MMRILLAVGVKYPEGRGQTAQSGRVIDAVDDDHEATSLT